MYGPIMPVTQNIGRKARMTAKGGKIGWPSNFTHSMNGGSNPVFGAMAIVPIYILDHDDGVIDQQTERENQRKQA